MLRIHYFVCAIVFSNLLTYFLTVEPDSGIPAKKDFAETVLIQNPRNAGQFESFDVDDYSTSGLSHIGNLILGLEPSSIRTSLLDVLVAGWFETDHIGLAEWLNQQPETINVDSAVVVFSRLASQVDPETSVEWAASVSNEHLKKQTLREVAGRFRSSYPSQFHEYMSNGGAGARFIASTGFVAIPSPEAINQNEEVAIQLDIIEEESEPIELILARRVHLAGSSSRINNVKLDQD